MKFARRPFAILGGFALAAALLTGGPGRTQADEKPSGDTSEVHWVYPGDFDAALARCREEKRLLIFKTVMFGVDEEGATCATKGKW